MGGGRWFIWLTVFSVVGSIDFGSLMRQSIREGVSGKGALQCPLGDKRKKALCLTTYCPLQGRVPVT